MLVESPVWTFSNFDGFNCLSSVVTGCNAPCVKVCLRNRADVQLKTTYRRLGPLTFAAMYSQADSAEMLLKARAQVDDIDAGGMTALDWARAMGDDHFVAVL